MTTVRTHVVATRAYECVEARRESRAKKKYGALAHKLPGMIIENGLAQATGFLLAKGDVEHRDLLNDLNAVLAAAGATKTNDGSGLHQAIIDGGLDRTLVLTRRSLEASGWLKRYAQGVLGVSATGDDEQDSATGGDEQDGDG